MSTFGKALVAGVMILASAIGLVAVAEAQRPIRIGASASKTGTYAAQGQNQLRGYQLCVKHANDKGGVLGRRIDLLVEDDQSKAPTWPSMKDSSQRTRWTRSSDRTLPLSPRPLPT